MVSDHLVLKATAWSKPGLLRAPRRAVYDEPRRSGRRRPV